MKRRNMIQAAALVTVANSGIAPAVFAHGSEDHSNKAGSVKKEQKACLIAGHYQAGMIGKISVVAS